jgi:hypothetical protein
MASVAAIAFVAVQAVLVGIVATARTFRATFRRLPRLILAGALAGVVVVVPATAILTGRTAETEPHPVADNCLITTPNGIVIPACGPGLSGGSVSAGAPSQELITLKNWCNLYIGGCSSAFYYPPGPVQRPPVDNTVRHSP